MFTIYSFSLLLKLRKHGTNFTCFDNGKKILIYNDDDITFKNGYNAVKPGSSYVAKTTIDVLDMLARYQYIEYQGNKDYFSVTHHGLRIYHIFSNSLVIFLYKSVLVPIIVSILTTLLLKLYFKI